MGQSMYNHS